MKRWLAALLTLLVAAVAFAAPYTTGDTALARLWFDTPEGRQPACTAFWIDPGGPLGRQTQPRETDSLVSWLVSAGHCRAATLVSDATDSTVFGWVDWRVAVEGQGYATAWDLAVGTAPDVRGPDKRWFTLAEADPAQGQLVYVHGFPLGVEHVAAGVVEGPSTKFPGSLVVVAQTSMIAPGASGSPVMDHYGNVVGVLWGLDQDESAPNRQRLYVTPVSALRRALDLITPKEVAS